MHGITHLGFFIFETIGQRDAGPVFLAGRRVFDGLYIGLDDTLYPDCRMPLLTIDIEGDRSHERPDPVGADGREDFPVRPTMLTALQSGQCLALIRGRPFVDDRAPHAVALVYRARPPDDGSKTHVVQPGVAEVSLVDLPCSSGFTLPSCRQRIELARTAPAAAAAHHFFTCDPPFSFVGSLIFFWSFTKLNRFLVGFFSVVLPRFRLDRRPNALLRDFSGSRKRPCREGSEGMP